MASIASGLSPFGVPATFASKSLSCISQNFPCLPAAIAARAAYGASGCMGSGLCLKASRTSFPYRDSICFSTGMARPQYGHWKSENSMIVTFASASPFTGAFPSATL